MTGHNRSVITASLLMAAAMLAVAVAPAPPHKPLMPATLAWDAKIEVPTVAMPGLTKLA